MARFTKTINIKDDLEDVIAKLSSIYNGKPIPYGIQFRVDGGVVNVYTSGKLVYQGEEDGFYKLWQWLALNSQVEFPFPSVGCDEAGKGEYLGPLVATCVWVGSESDYLALQREGFMDSKELKGHALEKLYTWIKKKVKEGHYKISFKLLTPAEYDDMHEKTGNVTRILDYMYVDILLRMPSFKHVVVDRYSPTALVPKFIKYVVMETKAESYFHVAAASVVSKVIYEKWIAKNVPLDIAGILRQGHTSIKNRKSQLGDIDISRWVKNAFKESRDH